MNPHKASINQPLYSLFIQRSYWFLLWLSNKPAGPVAHWPLEEPPLPRGSVNQLIWVRHDLPNRQPDLSFSTELNTDWNEFSFHLLHLKFNFVFPFQCKIMKLSTWRRLAPLRPWVFDAMKGFLKHFLLHLFILVCTTINKLKLFVYSPLCLEATVCEEAIFVPEVRLCIWQLNQEFVCTWLWAKLPMHRVWCTTLLIYITTFLYVRGISEQYFPLLYVEYEDLHCNFQGLTVIFRLL